MIKKTLVSAFLLASTTVFSNMTVTTTIYPLYSIAKEVGGDKIKLQNLIPFGVEAHGFDPTPTDMAKLSKSDIFITSGDSMEPWKDKIVKSLKIEQKVFDMSEHIKLKEIQEENEEHHEHEHGTFDPHYWVSLNNYILMTEAITKLFIEKDSINKDFYIQNSNDYLTKVKALKEKYDLSMATCTNKKILVNHDAFGYFADDYGVKQYSISGMSPEDKPSAKQISELIDLVKNEKINSVFFEEFASPKVAQTIAKAANVKIDALRPAENISKEENKKGYGYLQIMEDNLEKLKFAMDCK
ncbi:metal ABC transporter substrate-binding protein [Aliarcobacter butzleri]|uniref:Metal ABC transporter substrate-binding protein n=1 Tax=Aliarcobacter butzleri TaxID=28197 RepID=A0AAW7QC70_9BACT|nr:metal ABC transporter substrate-binding protein [Aliarcobacter butzleri]MDN5107935.1 metal ABC transporter substrate-binding protein [Aliarcobacter butzleri]MDN5123691.1 metal ABC transporter substrate-binding protein [Aliarcobacter butzleri]